MIRCFDFIFSLFGLIVLSPILIVVFLIGFFDTGSPLFFQLRVGRNRRLFTLVKFRTMRIGSAQVATHLADASIITAFGCFLRRTKVDELPQLWNVLLGDMSLVGPRPNLPSQLELIGERERFRVYAARPGITGLAQVQGIDMSTPALLAQTDRRMLDTMTIRMYFIVILMTALGKGGGDRVRSNRVA
jgi:lipopolysaccharide/colanic/teichoic acid biosynthesis glycosyltransferase